MTNIITLENGITITVESIINPNGYTDINTTITEIDIEVGQELSHVGGRPSKPK